MVVWTGFGPSSIPVRVTLTHSTAGLAYGHRRTRLRKHDDRTRLRLDRYRNGERSQRGYGGRESVTELETAMYRIVHEALTNAIRRGGARRASIDIREDEDTVRITVRGDGRASTPQRRPLGSV